MPELLRHPAAAICSFPPFPTCAAKAGEPSRQAPCQVPAEKPDARGRHGVSSCGLGRVLQMEGTLGPGLSVARVS